MPKNILIFSDGTGQAGGISLDERRSNIYKLYRATRVSPDFTINPVEQVAYYDAGLGSLPPSGGVIKTCIRIAHNFLSQATGFGLTTNIIDCYESIIRLWRPGDRIYLFGFSRGAYTARCVAGVLAHCGVPTRLENGVPMKYDSATAHRLAKIAVKKVYQHTASVPLAKATPRQKELMEQRNELARQFRKPTLRDRKTGRTTRFLSACSIRSPRLPARLRWSFFSLPWLASQPLLHQLFGSISRLLESCWVHRLAVFSRVSPRLSVSTLETGGIGFSPCWPPSPSSPSSGM